MDSKISTPITTSIITLDGPAGVGKSTIARQVAEALGMPYMDTGAMFRTIAMHVGPTLPEVVTLSDGSCALDSTVIADLEARILGFDFGLRGAGSQSILSCNGRDIGDEIRTEEVGALAAKVATIPVVRQCLKAVQQRLGAKQDLVAEGRDMGTEIFPHAAHKFFLDAAPEIRAQRRFDQLVSMGKSPDLALLTEQIKQRDDQDRNRAVAPLKPAHDAAIVDTGHMSIEEVFQHILNSVGKMQ
ncbi:MAG: (d)CMP kinase [Pseudomonadota bacterium]